MEVIVLAEFLDDLDWLNGPAEVGTRVSEWNGKGSELPSLSVIVSTQVKRFHIQPGYWRGEADCLHAGTHSKVDT